MGESGPLELAGIYVEPAQTFSTMPVASVSQGPGAIEHTLVVWYDPTVPGIQGTVKNGNTGNWTYETHLLVQGTTSALTLAPNANSLHRQPFELSWVVGSTLKYVTITLNDWPPSPPTPVLGPVETIVSAGGGITQPSIVNVGPQPGISWIDDGTAITEGPLLGGPVSPSSLRYRERSGTGWNTPVTIWGDYYGGISSPNVTFNTSAYAVSVSWVGGTSIRHANRIGGNWSSVSTVISGTTPNASVSVPGNTGPASEILLSRGGSAPLYPIQRSVISYGGGQQEKPLAQAKDSNEFLDSSGFSSVFEGRGGQIAFENGSMHIAVIGASINGDLLRYPAINDTLHVDSLRQIDFAATTLPQEGVGLLDLTVQYRANGDIPTTAHFRLELRDAESGTVLQTLREFQEVADTVLTLSVPLIYAGRSVTVGLVSANMNEATGFTLERWFVPIEEGNRPGSLVGSPSASESQLPTEFGLQQNFPNPFNPSTVIRYQLPEASYVTIRMYDVIGREVRLVVDEAKEPGYYEVALDASSFASGIYLYRMQAGDFVAVRKLLLMK